MRRRKNNKIYLLIIVLLILTIGFAALSTTLKINGNALILKNTWSIYWDNIHNQQGATPSAGPTIGADENDEPATLVTFTVDLDKPGDYYEFLVDAVNDGTIDAQVQLVNKSDIPAAYRDVITYNVTYENYAAINKEDRIDAKTKSTYRVLVKYRDDINASQIIADDVSLDLTFSISYEQADAYNIRNANVSMYSWDDSLIQNYFYDDVLATLKKYNVSRIYQCISYQDITRENTQYYNFIKRMHDNGIKVYTMFGDPSFYNHPDYLKNDIDLAINYNNTVDAAHKITGVVFDIEPYGDATYNADVETGFRTLVATYEETAKYAHEHGIEVVYAIPYWYESYYDDGYSEEFSNEVRSLLERIIKAADITSVMNYSIESSTSDMDDEVELAKANNKMIETISEFGRYDSGTNLTFWYHEHPTDDALALYKTMFNKYKYQNFGMSYHHLGNLLQIDKDYQYYHFHFYDSDNSRDITDDRYDYIEDNETKFTANIDWRGNATMLTKSDNFTVKAKGYINSSLSLDHEENSMKYMNVNHTGGKIEYQVEFYTKYDNEDPIPDGQICLTEVGDTLERCRDVYTTLGVYHLIYLSPIYLSTKYDIYYLDSNNNRHELTSCEYNNNNNCKTNDGKFMIDMDYTPDRYAGLTVIFAR